MDKFKKREEVNRDPDAMAHAYEFVKVDADEFISFIEAHDADKLWSIEKSPLETYLENIFPEHHWSVTGDAIYKSLRVPAASDNVISRSELQKWVARVEAKMLAKPARTLLTTTDFRKILREILGK